MTLGSIGFIVGGVLLLLIMGILAFSKKKSQGKSITTPVDFDEAVSRKESVDLIFRGEIKKFNFNLVDDLIPCSIRKYIMDEEGQHEITSKLDVLRELNLEEYVDVTFSFNGIMLDLHFPGAYINIVIDKEVEVLFFFDPCDLEELHKWCYLFLREYGLNRFVCRGDGYDEHDPYFFEFGWYKNAKPL